MKKILVIPVVLVMATIASASLKISVNGVIDPPDTEIFLKPSEWATIDLWSDGTTLFNAEFFLKVEGLGSYDITQSRNYFNPPGYPDTIFELEPGLIFTDLARPIEPAPIPRGVVIDKIRLYCDGYPGDITLTSYGDYLLQGSVVFDTQVIHQIPEPITLALLGLGGLSLHRRK